MFAKRRLRLPASIAGRLAASLAAGLAIGVLHTLPAAADLQYTLDLSGCKIGCDIPGMEASGIVVFEAADPDQDNQEPNWQITQIQVTDRQIIGILSQLMSGKTIVQDYYSAPYLARIADQKLSGLLPGPTGPAFSSELPLSSYVGFVQPQPILSTATPNISRVAAATVPEPSSFALLGVGVAGLVLLRHRWRCYRRLGPAAISDL
jgi:hypothetical protein